MELAEWASRYGLVAGITTRGHGFSLGLWSEEGVGEVMTRWRAFRAAFQGRFPTLVLSHQVHGTRVDWHEQRAAHRHHSGLYPRVSRRAGEGDCRVAARRLARRGRWHSRTRPGSREA